MIIEGLMNLICKLIMTLLSPINIPDISATDKESLFNFFDNLLGSANALIDLFLPYTLAKAFLLIVIAIELAVDIYKVVMWIIRKIPVAGMS